MAGSNMVVHHKGGSQHLRTIVCTLIGDAANGSVPDTVLPAFEGFLLALVTQPGVTQPTNNYGVTVVDQYGHDVLEAVGAARSATLTQKAPIVYSGTSVSPPIAMSDVLTMKIAGQSVNSANITVSLYYSLGTGA